MRLPFAAQLLLLAVALGGCATTQVGERASAAAHGSSAAPPAAEARAGAPGSGLRRFWQRGVASWYGRRFHGRRTASGEPFDMHALTAAHPSLPMDTQVRVRNPANGREVVVRINDRGPFHGNRIIDLSYAAARALGLLRGTGVVELEPLRDGDGEPEAQ